ncbi:hypothetical protein TCAL_16048 [Tigriopus californicus]|uniref:Uncharacterized protein n=1 Tax=Tigriopus californicus TaxID=6832 RepID=A0A553PNU6_TIGCA|nr:hypothetical protein TCAL_16048 [Tigriopus californicus]
MFLKRPRRAKWCSTPCARLFNSSSKQAASFRTNLKINQHQSGIGHVSMLNHGKEQGGKEQHDRELYDKGQEWDGKVQDGKEQEQDGGRSRVVRGGFTIAIILDISQITSVVIGGVGHSLGATIGKKDTVLTLGTMTIAVLIGLEIGATVIVMDSIPIVVVSGSIMV